MTFDNRCYLHLLNCFPDFGPARLRRLTNHFPDFQAAYEAFPTELIFAGIEPNIAGEWISFKSKLNIEKSIQRLHDSGIQLLTYSDGQYPQLLREIPQPPPLLYYRGALGRSDELCLGVVGTRKISAYGLTVTPELVEPLAAAGITIVSGLAYGVDGKAHRAALDVGGRTIAVLGGGLDDATLYPRNHVDLAHKIIDSGGLLLSEYPPQGPALRQHFVVRNRIIAGMSASVLIIECGIKSGALITAQSALEQNRDVYAVPGPIYSSTSEGTHRLLKDGAKLTTEAEDILQDLNMQISVRQIVPPEFISLTRQEQEVLTVISREPILADDIIARAELDPSVTTAALTFLEIKGYIKNLGAQQYARIR